MTEAELISKQAKTIEELRERIDKAIRIALVSRDLHDEGTKEYTRMQKLDFTLIVDLLEGRLGHI